MLLEYCEEEGVTSDSLYMWPSGAGAGGFSLFFRNKKTDAKKSVNIAQYISEEQSLGT